MKPSSGQVTNFIEATLFQQVKYPYYKQLVAVNTMNDKQNPVSANAGELARELAQELESEVAQLMIESLNLDVTADQISSDAPLYGEGYGEGLGLDSIDVLEVALVVSKRYGLQLRADSADNQHIFSSLRSLTDYIATHRTR